MEMLKRAAVFLCVLAISSMAVPARGAESQAGGAATDYRIGPGDVLNIEVWKDPALTRLAAVLPDGKIAFPLIGEIVAEGKTVAQLREEVAGKLSRYVKDAVVTVEVREMKSLQVYVLGRVNAPGRAILTADIDVLQALAIAGGPNSYANRSRIRIIRKEGNRRVIIPFDYDEVAAGRNLESNVTLQRGDVIIVP